MPQADASFVARMEDVLDLYEQAYDPHRPLVCYDETSKQLIAETRTPLLARPGEVRRYDYEYRRNGVRNLSMVFEPLANYRHVIITPHRTRQDFARAMKWLVDVRYPDATCIVVVLDNLNTHTEAALYETYPPAEANRICRRLEFHYTPKHASWLNMAEIELSVFARSCLGRRMGDEQTLKSQVGALEAERNQKQAHVEWRFRTENARIKLKSLYPSISD